MAGVDLVLEPGDGLGAIAAGGRVEEAQRAIADGR